MTEEQAIQAGWTKIYRPEIYEHCWIDPQGNGHMTLPNDMPEEVTLKPYPRVVVCAAIRSRISGKIICGARHYDSIMRAIAFPNNKREGEWLSAEQGFIDQFGGFMDRSEAWNVAYAAQQIKPSMSQTPGTLYSEDLY